MGRIIDRLDFYRYDVSQLKKRIAGMEDPAFLFFKNGNLIL
jgi:hypothetical protein